jgi:hypothetical protein
VCARHVGPGARHVGPQATLCISTYTDSTQACTQLTTRPPLTRTPSPAPPPPTHTHPQGGKTLREILAASGAATLDIAEGGGVGSLTITGPSTAAVEAAASMVRIITGEAPPGTIVRGARVERVSPFGAFVEVAPNKSGLVHLSEVDVAPVRVIEDVMKVGEGGEGRGKGGAGGQQGGMGGVCCTRPAVPGGVTPHHHASQPPC